MPSQAGTSLRHKNGITGCFRLCRDLLGLATNPIPIKTAMELLGRDTGELRLPMTPLDKSDRDSLAKTLTAYGLL